MSTDENHRVCFLNLNIFQPFHTEDWHQVLEKHINFQSVQLSDVFNYPGNCNYLISLLYDPTD